jgi:hypothetical protein
MTITRKAGRAVLISGVILASVAWADTPPNTVSSDTNGNTAMGTYTMSGNVTSIDNTGAGYESLRLLSTGSYNTAAGAFSLGSTSSGSANAALGYAALYNDTYGSHNTAVGSGALYANTGASNNVAVGYGALYYNDSGYSNVADGYEALYSNSSGFNNTASGYLALFNNFTGHQNSAIGSEALYSNTSGDNNIAIGANSLRANSTGGGNIGLGVATLQSTTVGVNNLAIGANALNRNVSGSSNIAIGANAGLNITGKNNIDISNEGKTSDVGVIRIGDTQTETFVAGISTSKVTGAAVYITSTGQLGTLASSERYKVGVETMGAASDKLEELRPVTYRLKSDPAGAVQYGLIAEEVAKIYPDLVFRNAEGGIEGVRYEELTPLLLNEVQQERKDARLQRQEVQRLSAEFAALKQQLAEVTAAMDEGRARMAQR